MIEKLHLSLDSGGVSPALLNDLSKALDCLPQLLTAKYFAQKVDLPSDLPVVENRNSYSSWHGQKLLLV